MTTLISSGAVLFTKTSIKLLEDRLTNIGSMRCVDAAIKQIDYDPSDELKKLGRIDILTKGDDWDYIPGTETIEDLGGKLVKFSYTNGFSTSSIVEKLNIED